MNEKYFLLPILVGFLIYFSYQPFRYPDEATTVLPVGPCSRGSYHSVCCGDEIHRRHFVENCSVPVNSTSEELITLTPNLQRKLLRNVSKQKKVNIEDFSCIEVLCLTFPQQNERAGKDVYLNISNFKKLKNLQKLVMVNINVSSLQPLENLTRLNELYINEVPIENISALRNLENLEVLRVQFTSITDVDPLKNLTELKILILESNRLLTNVTALENLNNLSFIDIRHTSVSKEDYIQLREALPETEIQWGGKKQTVNRTSSLQELISKRLENFGYIR